MRSIAFAASMLSLVLVGCATQHVARCQNDNPAPEIVDRAYERTGYRHRYESQSCSPLRERANEYVIQIDDNGNFWDQSVAKRALDKVAELADRGNVLVVMFIHGWHHNADPDTGDYEDFVKNLRTLRHELEKPLFIAAREELTDSENVETVGIYIGWRGRSAPSWADYFTVWGRHEAAKRVGAGELRQFVAELQAVYLKANAINRENNYFMGLTSMGHSFGGQILFKATEPLFMAELERAGGGVALEPLEGFGDMVVLWNPAMEASQYLVMQKAIAKVEFTPEQLPLLFVASSPDDWARQLAFPIKNAVARIAGGEPTDPGWAFALGYDEAQRTHELVPPMEHHNPDECPTEFKGGYAAYREDILNGDLTVEPKIGRYTLNPYPGHRAHVPYLIATLEGGLLRKHGKTIRCFQQYLTEYVALVQGKRMLLRSQARAESRAGLATAGD